jgi:hypothetical protein
MAVYTVLLTLFRVDRLNRASSIMRGALAIVTLAGPLVFASFVGVSGAAWGFVLAVGAAAVIGALLLFRQRRPRAPQLY